MCIENSPELITLTLPQKEPLHDVVAALFPRRFSAAPCSACEHESVSSRRRKLWEISAAYHCAIIGTCLPVSELSRLARRAGAEVSGGASDYGLHHAAVNLANERNALSELIHKALETRYTHAERASHLARESAQALAGRTARCVEIEDELRKTRAERDAAERELRGLLRELCSRDDCPRECGDLAGRRVLCVGGRTGSVEQYRALVERWRGGFVHHDGGLEHNAKRLQAMLGSADAVICAAAHVSHGAYYVVKRFCKQHGKPCVLLKGSGLASFLNGLQTLATQ